MSIAIFRYHNRKYRRKLPLWKREKEKKRVHNVYRWVFLSLFVTIVTVGFWHGAKLGGAFISFVRGNGIEDVLGKGGTNIVIDYGQVALVSFDTVTHSIHAFVLPKDVYVKIANTQNQYRVMAVYTLAEQHKKGTGGEALMRAAQDIFGVPIDGYIKLTTPIAVSPTDAEKIRKNISNISFLGSLIRSGAFDHEITTNLSSIDVVRLWWQVRSTRFDKVVVNDFGSHNIAESNVLADGSKVLSVSDTMVDSIIGDVIKDTAIVKENDKVEIINASGKNGLATQFARLVTNLGAQIIKTDTATTLEETSKIIVTDKKKSENLLGRLLKLRHFVIIESQNNENSLGDVTIILGTD